MTEKNVCGIYKIISPTDRIYIGQSVNIRGRFYKYRNLNCEEQVKLYNSIKKYNWENHTFEVIERCLEEDLNCRERYWQDYYDVLNGGLNCTLQECGEKRREFSEEWRKNHSIAMTGRKLPPEVIIKMAESQKTRYENIPNKLIGRPLTQEHRDNISS